MPAPQPTNPAPAEDVASTALALAEQRINALARPEFALDLIGDALDFIADVGANPEALSAIQDGAQQLIDTIAALDTAFKNTLVAAKAIHAQRQNALSDLTELQKAIKNQDRREPLIDDLVESLHQEAIEDAESYLYDTMYESEADDIEENTGLSWEEANQLMSILRGGHDFAPDDYAWDDLRDWLEGAVRRIPKYYRYLKIEPDEA